MRVGAFLDGMIAVIVTIMVPDLRARDGLTFLRSCAAAPSVGTLKTIGHFMRSSGSIAMPSTFVVSA
jgi:hypothetical protein